MNRTFAELPGWTFQVKEVSAGMYKMTGESEDGRKVSTLGTDYDRVLEEATTDAAKASRPRTSLLEE